MHRCAHLALVSLILLDFFLTLASTVPVHAASSRYVATTGDDTGNDCLSALNPCVTIAYAISQAASGDTLEIAAGTYTEAGITVNKDLTITGATAPSTIVQAAASAGVATNSVFQISSGFTISSILAIPLAHVLPAGIARKRTAKRRLRLFAHPATSLGRQM